MEPFALSQKLEDLAVEAHKAMATINTAMPTDPLKRC